MFVSSPPLAPSISVAPPSTSIPIATSSLLRHPSIPPPSARATERVSFLAMTSTPFGSRIGMTLAPVSVPMPTSANVQILGRTHPPTPFNSQANHRFGVVPSHACINRPHAPVANISHTRNMH